MPKTPTAPTLFLVATAFAAGLIFGRTSDVTVATAQDAAGGQGVSENAATEIRSAGRAIQAAGDELRADGQYNPATTVPSPFLILSGGGDAVADLDAGDGVDPDTFAALYAGLASDEVKPKLSTDDDGRLLYNGKPVRMYSIKKLQAMYKMRSQLEASEGL